MTLAGYATLARLGPILTTAEAAAALRVSTSSATRLLRDLEAHSLARHVRHGVWLVGMVQPDPLSLADEITRPYPSYVSFVSALNLHGMIDQLPREITVASLDRSKRVATELGTYRVSHLPPELFGGWTERDGIKLATPEKALFDIAYIGAAHGARPRRIPELELPPAFHRSETDRWLARIPSTRLRSLTSAALAYELTRAIR